METFTFRQGTLPILVSIPHNGSKIPDPIAATMTPDGRNSRDTDWFLDRLYDLPELTSASMLVSNVSRYVVDLNRSIENQNLYPGQTTTGLIPQACFDGAPIYLEKLPSDEETKRRVATFWKPYHERLEQELQRLVETHKIAILVEAHSIASKVPRLFEGALPDFNLGTFGGQSCAASLQDAVVDTLASQQRYSYVVNQRFIGGHITRHYGRPKQNRHALQIELSQATYMDESTLTWDEQKARQVQPVFQQIFKAIQQWLNH